MGRLTRITMLSSHRLGGLLLCAVVAQPAAAQTTSEADGNEIVVTATKQGETRLQDVSISIQALSEETLRRTASDGLRDVVSRVPSLTAVDNGLGQTRLIIRGVNSGTEEFPESSASTVGLYYDEAPVTAGGMNPDLRLFDVQRVEVLRGPQGTLYGEGAMGGAVRIITNPVRFGEYEGAAELGLSTTHEAGGLSARLNGMVNVPIAGDTLALRAVGTYRRDAGFVDNPVLGLKNVNDGSFAGLRLRLGYRPSDDLVVNFNYIYQRGEVDDRAEWAPLTAGTRAVFGFDDHYQTGRNALQPGLDVLNLFNATAEWDLGDISLVSSTTYYDRDVDLDVAFFGNVLASDRSLQNFSQELRLSGGIGERLRYVLGGFFNWKNIERLQSEIIPNADGTATREPIFQRLTALSERQLALFSEINFDVTDRLTLTGGLRWFSYEQQFENRLVKCGTGPRSMITQPTNIVNNLALVQATFAADCPRATIQTPLLGDAKDNVLTPKFNIAYKITEDNLVYVQAAKGFRVGGVNPAIDSQGNALPDSYGPDSLWTYEVGLKNEFGNGLVTFNVAAYRTEWSDLIANVLGPDNRTAYRTNAGEARIDGVEVDLTVRPLTGISLFAGVAYTDARLTKDEPLLPTNPTLGRAGDRLPLVPKWTANGALQYDAELGGDWNGYARVDMNYVGPSGNTFNPANSAYREAGDYANVSVRTGVQSDRYSLQLYVNNLFNARGTTYQFLGTFTGPGLDSRADGDRLFMTPRTIGVIAGVKF